MLLRNSAIRYRVIMQRRSYKIDPIIVNEKIYYEVIIDSHYEEKHSEHINDELILSLVQRLNGRFEIPVGTKGEYSFYLSIIELKRKRYRLVWLLEENAVYIGVVNAFRDRGE